MKVWITCFVLLFGTMELLQWVEQFSLPLPIFVLGGAFLAIASNYSKLTHLPFHLDYKKPESLQEANPAASMPLQEKALVQNDVAPHRDRSSRQTVSFTINKPHQPGD